jgi:hypothetical protein
MFFLRDDHFSEKYQYNMKWLNIMINDNFRLVTTELP